MHILSFFQPEQNTIKLLRALLQQAEAGELLGFAYTAAMQGGQVQSGYASVEDCYCMVGQLERLKNLLLKEIDSSSVPLDVV